MGILGNVSTPEGGAVHTEALTNAFVKDEEFGVGTLYITEEYVWSSC